MIVPAARRAASSTCALLALALVACKATDVLSVPTFTPTGDLPTYAQLQAALDSAQKTNNGGLGTNMWGVIVDHSGVVAAVVKTGPGPADTGEEWLGSRVIAAQKANTANDFSLLTLALSTANLYSAVQPGGSLYGLQASNPVNPDVAYGGNAAQYGTPQDYMVDRRIGGINVFGGGVAMYDSTGNLVGGLGVSGDFSCADHNIAWKVRHILNRDYVPAGVDPVVTVVGHTDDNIVYDIDPTTGKSASGWGHPTCTAGTTAVSDSLPTSYPIRYVP
jgi:uncharacterized protein GlcG (DUF336 family)